MASGALLTLSGNAPLFTGIRYCSPEIAGVAVTVAVS